MPKKQQIDTSEIRAPGVLARTAGLYPSLPRAQRRVADFVGERPEIVKGLTIAELSRRTGAGQATILRFCRAIGFRGYTDLKLALAEELGQTTRAIPTEHGDVVARDSPQTIIQKVFALDIQVIANTRATVDPGELSKAIDALGAARTVALFGSGGSLAVNMDAYYRLLRCGVRCQMSVDSHMQAINAGLLEPGDVGFAISFSGETKDVIDCARLAKRAGASVVCLTNHPRSSLAHLSDICLAASSTRTRWIHDAIAARLGQLAIIDALCVGICCKNEAKITPIVERIERAAATKRVR